MEPISGSENIINSVSVEANVLKRGLTIFTAAVFIVGEMSGTGVLSLPKSLDQSGWYGVIMIIFCCIISGYCGIILSSCWILIISKNESIKYGTRDPFPVIAYEAAGNIGRYIVAIICYLQLFGVAVIFLLIASHNIRSLLDHFLFQFCDWTIIVALLMCPISMLGTPKDFWPIAVMAMLFTAIACLLMFIQSLRQLTYPLPHNNKITFKSFFISFGTILFCFGGAVMFPTIQADMINPMQFDKSVIIAYTVMIIFYLPVALSGFLIFGSHTQDSIIDNLNHNWLRTAVLILITGHLLTAFNIILNPMFQGFEKLLKAPAKFGWQRVLIRTGIILCVLFVAQTIPNFGPILSFIGGSCVSSLSFVLPCIFYILLCRNERYHKYISKFEYSILIVCIVIGTIGGIASTYSSIDELINPKTFKIPCYVNRTQ